ncbi:MAG: Type IV pilus assembly protein PilM [Candidatus Moranbacteria bacterium GW2011_GWE1_35_17]|nr:MAG: Type IV pilus assembly protein PilM [Candidatus Moranbacteria bacterium GW2011_GWE1_35_17]KKP73082.1 MAG: Type IV pilus assembly protein PilM [Candidatus Moranbacteria bacterium GW2011_GWE2_35_164]KKP84834.1 MAG: Type IV pilus assembly protein PilM [Candidatus Moranbacteria bacterium GW2011_GWF2_35_54]
MFSIPGINKNYSLGVDFGTSSIKIVELEYKNGSSFLSNYGWIEIPQKKKVSDFEIKNDSDEEIEKIQLLKKLIEEMGIKSKSAYIAMGSFKGLSAMISVNDIHEDNLDDVIRAEASKYIPVSLDEVYLSSDIVSKRIEKNDNGSVAGKKFLRKKEKEVVDVLLVAAPKDDVHRYERIVEGSGLKVASLELDIFSATRSLVGDDLGKFLIIDIGAKITNIILVDKGVIRVNRNINVGGDEITKNIASNLNVSWDRAEEFKKKNNYLKEEGKAIVLPILNLIAKEAKRLVELVSVGNNLSKPLDKVILVGGGSDVLGIVDIFKETLGDGVVMGNPFEKVIIESDIIKTNIANISPKFSVATGLAIKGAEIYRKKHGV